MNRKRLGQLLIGGVLTLCAAAAAALAELVTKEAARQPEAPVPPAAESSGKNRAQ